MIARMGDPQVASVSSFEFTESLSFMPLGNHPSEQSVMTMDTHGHVQFMDRKGIIIRLRGDDNENRDSSEVSSGNGSLRMWEPFRDALCER